MFFKLIKVLKFLIRIQFYSVKCFRYVEARFNKSILPVVFIFYHHLKALVILFIIKHFNGTTTLAFWVLLLISVFSIIFVLYIKDQFVLFLILLIVQSPAAFFSFLPSFISSL